MKLRTNSIVQGCARVALLVSLAAASFCQSAAPTPVFELADVHPSPHRNNPELRGGLIHGDRYQLRDATMVDLVAAAYNVDPINISGSQAWLEFDRYDIFAKPPAGASRDAVPAMLRALLADRFQLKAHSDIKPVPAFVLTAGKMLKLKPTDPSITADAEGGCQYQAPPKDAPPAVTMYIKFACHNITMAAFADFLHQTASPYIARPLVDATNLKGAWDFDIQWTYQPPRGSGGIAIFDALDKQLGLKLELKTAPLPVVAIDSVNEKPTPNPPGLEKQLPPPPPAQFEVAVIRPTSPGQWRFDIDSDESGRVSIGSRTLQGLIAFAWDIPAANIVNKPKWLNDERFDIVGKAFTGPPPTNMLGMQEFDIDDIKEMMRSLLADRFKMVSHMEDRPVDAYVMVAANPRMKRADPINRPSCKEGPGPDGKDPRLTSPILSRLYSCQNMTMAQFSQELADIGSGYLAAPVIDATNLRGAYDFTLNFSRSRDLLRGGGPSGDGSASDPSGGLSLFDAMKQQLGLKMEKKEKVMVPHLVIDHIEQRPTEN